MTGTEHQRNREQLERDFAADLAAVTDASHQLEHRFGTAEQLHPNDFRALTAIYVAENADRPLTPSDLAGALMLSSGAITYLVERLVSSGHVRRDAHPSDRRKVVLRYADHGRAVASGFFGPLSRHTHAHLAGHTDEEIATAIRVLRSATAGMRTYDDELRAQPTKDPAPDAPGPSSDVHEAAPKSTETSGAP